MPNKSNTMAAGLLHANISDHKGIFCIDNNTLLCKKNVLISKINFSKINILKFTFIKKNGILCTIYQYRVHLDDSWE